MEYWKGHGAKKSDVPVGIQKNEYDLYLPKNVSEKLPVMLYIHGGFFVAGDKAETENISVSFASEGIAVASMNYELAPEAKYPAAVRQAAECIREICRRGDEGDVLDSSRIILAGDSAGAFYAALTAAVFTNGTLRELLDIPGGTAEWGEISCCILFCGPYNLPLFSKLESKRSRRLFGYIGQNVTGKRKWFRHPLISTACVMDYVTPFFPPSYITDGNDRSFEEQGRALEKALKKEGVLCRSRFFDPAKEKVPHVYEIYMSTPNARLAFEDAVSFIQETCRNSDS